MFGIGMPELFVILAIALIVVGPKRLPDIAKTLGRALGEFKKATSDLKETFEKEAGMTEVQKSFNELHLQEPVAGDALFETAQPDASPAAPAEPPTTEAPTTAAAGDQKAAHEAPGIPKEPKEAPTAAAGDQKSQEMKSVSELQEPVAGEAPFETAQPEESPAAPAEPLPKEAPTTAAAGDQKAAHDTLSIPKEPKEAPTAAAGDQKPQEIKDAQGK